MIPTFQRELQGTGHFWKQRKQSVAAELTPSFPSAQDLTWSKPMPPTHYTGKTALLVEKHLLGKSGFSPRKGFPGNSREAFSV